MREAGRLSEAGAFDGAARLLEQHSSFPDAVHAREIALCLHHWQRLDFEQARRVGARTSAPALVAVRSRLDLLARSDELSLPVLADLLHSENELRRWSRSEDSVACSYRALELAAKIRLAQEHGIRPPYAVEMLCEAAPSLEKKLRVLARDGTCSLGLQRLSKSLTPWTMHGHDYFADRRLRELLKLRNEAVAATNRQCQ